MTAALTARMVRVCMVVALTASLPRCTPKGPTPGASSQVHTAISVLGASSLREAMNDLKVGFEQTHPATVVRLVLAGSQILRLQVQQGAPADVVALADEVHMANLVDAGLLQTAQIFAANELVVITPLTNPAGIEVYADLPRAVRLVVGTPHVPIGRYTRAAFTRAEGSLGKNFTTAVHRHIVSEESNARLVRAKVALGEADAAVVYRTDAMASKRVRLVPIPKALNVRARYPIGIVAETAHPRAAAAFIAYVMSSSGQAILRRRGFLEPRP